MDMNRLHIVLIKSTSDFFKIYEELEKDKSDFLNNKDKILSSFIDEKLFCLQYQMNDDERVAKYFLNPMFIQNGKCYLPCFCTLQNNDSVQYLWVHTRARNKGFGKKFISLLNIKNVYYPLLSALPFWKKCDVQILGGIANDIIYN